MSLELSVTKINEKKSYKAVWVGKGLLILFLLLYLAPLDNRPLAIPDETRYAEVPREMLISGDWITPRLNGLRYFEKPPLGYWLNAMSISVLGENPFAVRLSSALAAGLTTLLIFLFTIKTLANKRIAWFAAFIHMTFFEVYFVGTFSVLDNLLTLFLSAAIMSYYHAVNEKQNAVAWRYWSISGVSLGLAFLTKGFLAIAVIIIVLAPWLIYYRYWQELLIKSWFVLLLAALVALPWALLIHRQESDFWHYFFWIEHVKRFTSDSAQHKAPFYYFLVFLPALAFPWLSLAPAALVGLRSSIQDQSLRYFLWLWLSIPFLFFSVSSGKLATYILPCFPPLAILIAVGLHHYFKHDNKHLFNLGILFNGLVLILVLSTLVVSQFLDINFTVYQQSETPQFVMTTVALLIGLLGTAWSLKLDNPTIKLLMNLFAIIPFIVLMQLATPKLLKESKAPGEFITQARTLINEDALVIADGAMLRAVNWYLQRDDAYLISEGEVSYGLQYPDATHRLLDARSFTTLLTNRGGRAVALFCRKGCPDAIRQGLPETSQRHHYGKFTMWFIP